MLLRKLLQRPLGRWDGALRARIELARHAQRARERLEHRLALVVRVVAAQVVDVQRDLRVVDEALEELVHQVDVELADQRAGERNVVLQPRAPGKIDHHARQRFVERHVGMAEAPYARLVADRANKRLAERDADVLDGVVRVDLEVTLRLDVEIDHSVARDLVEHVVEERNAARKARAAGSVEIHSHADPGLLGVAFDFRSSHSSASRMAVISIRFSSGVPTVTRRQLASIGCAPLKLRTSTPCARRLWYARSASGTRTRKKFACDGYAVVPGSAASASPTPGRSASTRSACSSSTSKCSSANSA